MEKTAVEWFFNELQRMQYFIGNDMLEAYKQAKEMEKEQIINAYINGIHSECYKNGIGIGCGKHYYNQTFKQD